MISFAEVNEVARGHHHPNVGSVAEGTDPHSISVCTQICLEHSQALAADPERPAARPWASLRASVCSSSSLVWKS